MSNSEDNNSFVFGKIDGGAAGPASLRFDPAAYRDDIDAFDITEQQKQELLLTLWSIMRSFVELGFTVDVCAMLANNGTAIPPSDELG